MYGECNIYLRPFLKFVTVGFKTETKAKHTLHYWRAMQEHQNTAVHSFEFSPSYQSNTKYNVPELLKTCAPDCIKELVDIRFKGVGSPESFSLYVWRMFV